MAVVKRKSVPKKAQAKAEPKKSSTTPKKVDPAITNLIDRLNKQYGVNAVSIGVSHTYAQSDNLQRIPTGSFTLDVALGGGLPVGRFIEISGAYSSTKTSQVLHIIREAQRLGLRCAFLDVEGTTDEPYLERMGIDVSSLIYSRPAGMEEACDMMLDLQKSGLVDLGVIDSIAAMSPNKEQETSTDETIRMGIPQQILGEFFRKYQANNNRLDREGKRPFTLIGVNQLREKIGSYGDPEYTPGGRAKGFAMSVDIRFRRGDWIAEGTGINKEFVGQVVKFKIDKNKTYKRMQSGEFDFYFSANSAGVPISYNDNEKEVVTLAVEFGIIERAGAWFKYKDSKFQGLPSLVEALREDKNLLNELKEQVMFLSTRENA